MQPPLTWIRGPPGPPTRSSRASGSGLKAAPGYPTHPELHPHHCGHHRGPPRGAVVLTPHHGAPQPVALCGHTPYGAHGGQYPRRRGPTTLEVAPQGGLPHPRCPDQAPHLDHPDTTSPRASRPMQDHGTPAPTVADNPGTPRQVARTSPSQSHQELSARLGPPYSP